MLRRVLLFPLLIIRMFLFQSFRDFRFSRLPYLRRLHFEDRVELENLRRRRRRWRFTLLRRMNDEHCQVKENVMNFIK